MATTLPSLADFLAAQELEPCNMFRLRLQAEELTRRRPTSDFDSMESLESSRDTQLLPHQIHAAHFAVSNPMLKGVAFFDEVGLGKTIEAAMVVKELVYRGCRNILIIASRSLCQQWAGELRERFAMEFEVLDARKVRELKRRKLNPYEGLRIATYHYVNGHLGEVRKTPWDLVVVDECHLLKNPQGALHKSIKQVPRQFMCLLTATPIQNYLPELQSICTLIDPEALGTDFSFREQFCEDPRGLTVKNLPDLKDRLSKFAIRTLRSDVPEIRFTRRTPTLFNFTLHDDERELYEGVSGYLARPNWAFGDNAAGKFLIIMAYRKLLASSSFALRGALRKVQDRLEEMLQTGDTRPLRANQVGPEVREAVREMAEEELECVDGEGGGVITKTIAEELEEVSGYVALCERIAENAKGERLVAAMPDLLKQGDKVLVFTQYKATMRYLARKLREGNYKVVEFSGDLKSHSNPDKDERELAKRKFHDTADVMIATDAGAEGLNLQFCHIVVNYDLPWNPMKIEQRIGRCHRIGQAEDVVVANLVAIENAVDARLVELLTDKIHLFNSVLGESDEILGAIEDGLDFERQVFTILQTCRTPQQIDTAFAQLQFELEEVIGERRARGRSLLQGFDDRIRDHLDIAEKQARQALDKRTALLRDFTLGSLEAHGAAAKEQEPGLYVFNTPSRFFLVASELLDPKYRGTFLKDGRESVTYLTKRHPLIHTALQVHLDAGRCSALSLAYTGNHNIHGMEEYVGKRGWWLNLKVSFSGFEVEDHLLQLGFVENADGICPDELLSENLHRITAANGEWDEGLAVPREGVVQEWAALLVSELEAAIIERNAEYYVQRREVLDKYYGAKGDGEVLAELRFKLQEKQRQVLELQDSIEATESATRKMQLMDQLDKVNDEYFELQQRMQTEQAESFEAKRKAIRDLEQLRGLSHTVELVSVAQWTMV
jgi:superfamily II DNA or RNA helicase